MGMQVKIGLVDDRGLSSKSLRHVLEGRPELEVAFATTHPEEVTQLIQTSQCTVLIVDLHMPQPILTELRSWAAVTQVVAVTAHERAEDALAALRAGACGVVLKRFDLDEVLSAIAAADRGEVWVPPALLQEVLARQQRFLAAGLTMRELEITTLVAQGWRNAEIAQSLWISERVVTAHLSHILRKLNARNRGAGHARYRPDLTTSGN